MHQRCRQSPAGDRAATHMQATPKAMHITVQPQCCRESPAGKRWTQAATRTTTPRSTIPAKGDQQATEESHTHRSSHGSDEHDEE